MSSLSVGMTAHKQNRVATHVTHRVTSRIRPWFARPDLGVRPVPRRWSWAAEQAGSHQCVALCVRAALVVLCNVLSWPRWGAARHWDHQGV